MAQNLFSNNLTLLSAMLAPCMRDVFDSNKMVIREFLNGSSGLVDKFSELEEAMPRDVTPEGLEEILTLKDWEDKDKQVVVSSYRLAYSEATMQIAYEQARETLFRAYMNYVYKGSAVGAVDKIKSSEIYFPKYGDLNDEHTRTKKFTDIQVESVDDNLGKHFKSSIPFINKHTLKEGGYYEGQVICISSPPGSGKSLFCLSEAISALNQGFKVHYTALGDLVEFDMIYRACTIILNKPMNTVLANLNKNYLDAISKFPELNNLTLEFTSPGVYTCQEWLDRIKHSGALDRNDVFIVDYDTNFRSTADNIYQKGDEIYTALVTLAKTYGKIVIVVSQPKSYSWGKDIELGDLSESSRKQHHIDVLIAISPDFEVRNSINAMGVMKIVKNRRGSLGKCFYLREPTGRYTEISKEMYDQAKASNACLYMEKFEGCETSEYTRLSAPDIMEDIARAKEDLGGLGDVESKILSN